MYISLNVIPDSTKENRIVLVSVNAVSETEVS